MCPSVFALTSAASSSSLSKPERGTGSARNEGEAAEGNSASDCLFCVLGATGHLAQLVVSDVNFLFKATDSRSGPPAGGRRRVQLWSRNCEIHNNWNEKEMLFWAAHFSATLTAVCVFLVHLLCYCHHTFTSPLNLVAVYSRGHCLCQKERKEERKKRSRRASFVSWVRLNCEEFPGRKLVWAAKVGRRFAASSRTPTTGEHHHLLLHSNQMTDSVNSVQAPARRLVRV